MFSTNGMAHQHHDSQSQPYSVYSEVKGGELTLCALPRCIPVLSNTVLILSATPAMMVGPLSTTCIAACPLNDLFVNALVQRATSRWMETAIRLQSARHTWGKGHWVRTLLKPISEVATRGGASHLGELAMVVPNHMAIHPRQTNAVVLAHVIGFEARVLLRVVPVTCNESGFMQRWVTKPMVDGT